MKIQYWENMVENMGGAGKEAAKKLMEGVEGKKTSI